VSLLVLEVPVLTTPGVMYYSSMVNPAKSQRL
jgi:hypothetical protein